MDKKGTDSKEISPKLAICLVLLLLSSCLILIGQGIELMGWFALWH